MARHGKLQNSVEHALARLVLGSMGILPRPVAVAVGRAIARMVYWLPGKLRQTGARNLAVAFPDLSEHEHRRLLRGSFDSLGRLLGEFSQFPRATPESLRQMIDYDQVGLAHLRE